ncbi:uncharacterized protein BJX67DRAFT_348134 [Aspergillus lucknowensis]|uniref:Uncharacterized protein n=1 Tax=Aspergillus lucknowensis TaxID=176173 RepID=A0ABR4LXQ5_9EURO
MVTSDMRDRHQRGSHEIKPWKPTKQSEARFFSGAICAIFGPWNSFGELFIAGLRRTPALHVLSWTTKGKLPSLSVPRFPRKHGSRSLNLEFPGKSQGSATTDILVETPSPPRFAVLIRPRNEDLCE